jgi:hypothetical protein
VWSRDDDTGAAGYRRVTQTFVTADQPTLELTLTGFGGTMQKLEVTGPHPFWVRERGWVAARDLQPGEHVDAMDGGWLRVSSRTWTRRRTTVYNFEVEDFHTYFVGARGVWVHNTCFKTFEQARNAALEKLGAIDQATRTPVIGRIGSLQGKVVGFETRVNGVFKRFRIDWDPSIGPHINVEIGKGSTREKFHITWQGHLDDVLKQVEGQGR